MTPLLEKSSLEPVVPQGTGKSPKTVYTNSEDFWPLFTVKKVHIYVFFRKQFCFWNTKGFISYSDIGIWKSDITI